MPAINPYLTFNGNCAEAMRFYERTLGGKLQIMTNGESPIADKLPPGNADRIMHARLDFDGGVLMASDDMPSNSYKGMHGFAVSVIYPTAAEARRVFEALAKGGKVFMPLDKAF
ncbi:MAG TPA: VOC family protein, partial [Thermoanaerobaculia bacterium]|nr:VOC family protein [Thermoanaerobaculia bacterium]